MKKTLKIAAMVACVMFTIMMTFSLVSGYIFSGANAGMNLATSILIASFATAVLQAFWFSGAFLKTTRYAFRMIGFAVMLCPSLFACGWFGGWFPQRLDSAAVFAGIFVVIFAVVSVGYSVYFKKTAGSYEQALKNYRESQTRNN